MCKVKHQHSMVTLETCTVCDLNENEVHESQTEKVQKVPHGHHVQWTDQLTVINIRAHEPHMMTTKPKSILKHKQNCFVFICNK